MAATSSVGNQGIGGNKQGDDSDNFGAAAEPEYVLVNTYVEAIHHLDDITTYHQDPTILRMRQQVLGSECWGTVTSDEVWALEVYALARGVIQRIPRSSQYRCHALNAVHGANMLWGHINIHRSDVSAGRRPRTSGWWPISPPPAEEKHSRWELPWISTCLSRGRKQTYRLLLRRHLHWPYTYAAHATKDLTSRSCPCAVAVYLELLIEATPPRLYAAAVRADPGESPLAFAWAWARTLPELGMQEADVMVLVLMARCAGHFLIQRLVKEKKANEKRAREEHLRKGVSERLTIWLEGRASEAATSLRSWSPTDNPRQAYQPLPDDIDKNRLDLQQVMQRLESDATLYLRLQSGDAKEERVRLLESICDLAVVLLKRWEPPLPSQDLQSLLSTFLPAAWAGRIDSSSPTPCKAT